MHRVVMDSETTIRNVGENAVGTFGASAFHPDNFLVSMGEYDVDEGMYEAMYDATGLKLLPGFVRLALDGEDVMLIGHNLGFDLQYCFKTWPEEMEAILPNLYIWDTQQVDYLLSGQTRMFPSLDQCAERLGLPLKPDKIKGYWAQGIDTPFIPKDELLEYQQHDVMTTLAVYQHQQEELMGRNGLYELVKVKMDDLLATIEMTKNGMMFDLVLAQKRIEELDEGKTEVYNRIMKVGQKMFPEGFEFNPLSSDHISMVLFGGTCKRKEDVVQFNEDGSVIHYKTGAKAGQKKTRKEDVEYPVKGLGFKPAKYGIPQMKSGNWSTDSEYLAKINTDFTKDVLLYRELAKDSETYYRGYSALVYPDNCIHPNINHESTATGRQSMTNPNLQNVTKDDDD